MKESIKEFFTDTIGRVIDYFILNIVFIITCLPIITIGTSCTAMYYVMFHVMDQEDLHLLRKYFKTWKECFVKSTVVWILALVFYLGLYMVFNTLSFMAMGAVTILGYSLVLIAFFLICSLLIYYFSLHARFENSVGGTLRNALILTISHLPVSFLCFIVLMAPVLIIFLIPGITGFFSGMVILFGFAVQNRLQSSMLLPIYRSLVPEEEK